MMPKSNLNALLIRQAALLRRASAASAAFALADVADGLAPNGPLLPIVDKLGQISATTGDGSTGRVVDLIRDLTAMLDGYAKKDVLADLGRLTDFLEGYRDMTLRDLLDRLRSAHPAPETSEQRLDRLRTLIGGEGFEAAMDRLSKDKSVKATDLVDIAVAFDLNPRPKDSKQKIIKSLLRLHEGLATFRLKQRAMQGRSAA